MQGFSSLKVRPKMLSPALPSPLTTSPPWQTKPLTMRWNLVPCNQISLEFHASESPECAAANPKY